MDIAIAHLMISFLNGKMDEIPELGIKLFQPKEYTN